MARDATLELVDAFAAIEASAYADIVADKPPTPLLVEGAAGIGGRCARGGSDDDDNEDDDDDTDDAGDDAPYVAIKCADDASDCATIDDDGNGEDDGEEDGDMRGAGNVDLELPAGDGATVLTVRCATAPVSGFMPFILRVASSCCCVNWLRVNWNGASDMAAAATEAGIIIDSNWSN